MGLPGPIFLLIIMININFLISNQYSNRWGSVWSKSGKPKNHKAWELAFYKTNKFIEVCFCLNFNCDHAGLQTNFSLFGYTVEYSLYDTRHWDYDNDKWEVYD